MAVVGDPRGFYGLLGVPRTAAPEEIRSAFRELAKRYHPDSSGGGADDERFRRLREAYEVLRDPARRLEYDAEALDAQRRRVDGRDNGRGNGRGDDWRHGEGDTAAAGMPGFGRRLWGGGRVAATGPDAADPGEGDDPADGSGRVAPRPAVLLAIAGALVLAVGGGAALLLGNGNDEASRLRAEADGLRVALDAAAREAEAGEHARRQAAAATAVDPDAALAAELGAGGGFVYQAELAFPPESGDLDEVLRAELDARLAEVRTAVSAIPQGRDWLLLVDGRNTRAATEAGVLVDEWGLALLRVGSVADFLVRAGVPADRLAVRFQAGFSPRGPEAATAGTAAADAAALAARTVELKVLCCLR